MRKIRKESPEERRERLRQLERKNPLGNLHDAHNRSIIGDFVDLVGRLNWKATGFIILLIIFIGLIIVIIPSK